MASVSNFVYTPLEDPEQCLRLLQLAPAERYDEDLYATLTVFRRDAAPPYRPISYTWGTEEASSQLLLRNHGQEEWTRFTIRPNIEALLRQVRSSLGPQYVWVDAICMDQTDNNEKGHQVRTMDKTYRDKHIFIWLGDTSENSTHAMDLINDFWTRYEDAGWSPGSPGATRAIRDFAKSSQVSRASWKAIYDLVCRPWFSRRWIVQEFVLSGPKDFWIGSRHQDFKPLICLILFFKETLLYVGEGEEKTDICYLDPTHPHRLPSPEIDPINRLERLWSAYLASQTGDTAGRTLEHLLDKFSGFASSDPRDGIYAFLSMASDIDSSEWFPDYSDQNPPNLLYWKAVLHIMSHGASLDIMARGALKFGEVSSIPPHNSWIPWFGPQIIDYESMPCANCQKGHQDGQRGDAHSQPHIHLLHGYNTLSLTTFGQSLQRLRHGQEGWIGGSSRGCDGCNKCIHGAGLKCLDCADFDYCHACARTSDTTHDPGHRFRYYNGAVYFASGRPTTIFLPGVRCPRTYTNDSLTSAPFAGFIVDRIKHEGVEGRPEMIRGYNMAQLQLSGKVIKEWSKLPGIEHHIDAGLVPDDRMLRVLTGNRRVSGGAVCHVTDSWIARARQIFVSRGTSVDAATSIEDDVHTTLEIIESINFMLSHRRKFTVTDNSMGFVPLGSVCGDSIAIFAGCSVPLVIRRLKDVWLVIGECYIDGLMEGEMAELPRGHKVLEKLSLV